MITVSTYHYYAGRIAGFFILPKGKEFLACYNFRFTYSNLLMPISDNT